MRCSKFLPAKAPGAQTESEIAKSPQDLHRIVIPSKVFTVISSASSSQIGQLIFITGASCLHCEILHKLAIKKDIRPFPVLTFGPSKSPSKDFPGDRRLPVEWHLCHRPPERGVCAKLCRHYL